MEIDTIAGKEITNSTFLLFLFSAMVIQLIRHHKVFFNYTISGTRTHAGK